MPSPAGEAAPSAAGWRGRLWRSPWLPAVLGVLAFANSTRNGFVYDDRFIVLDSPRIRDLTDWRGIWLTDWWQPADDSEAANSSRDRLYRPLAIFSFALNYAVHGHAAFGYHLVNVLLHGAVCWLVWHFSRRLTGDPQVASAAAVLFAVHPVHAEAVANIVGRAEVLSALFLLPALLVLMPDRSLGPGGVPPGGRGGFRPPSIGRSAAAAGLFFLALLSKETAVCYPALAVLVLWYGQQADPGVAPAKSPAATSTPASWRSWLLPSVVLALPVLVYLPLRYYASDRHFIRREPLDVLMNPLIPSGLGERIVGVLTAAGHYVRLLLAPDRLSCDYGIAIIDPRQGVTWATVLGMLAAIGAVAGLLQLRSRDALRRQIGVLTGLVVVSYVLISNVFLLIGVAAAERLMYWPSVPALLLVALLAVSAWRRTGASGSALAARPGLVYTLGAAVLAVLFLRTAVRNTDWCSNMALFTRDVETYPQGAHLHNCCAFELLNLYQNTDDVVREDPTVWPAARRHLSARGAWPDDGTAAEQRQALLLASEWHADRALGIFPGFIDALAVRGRIRAQLGRFEDAERDLQAVLAVNPGHAAARAAQVLVARQRGSPDRLAELQATVTAEPQSAQARVALARELTELGRYKEAEAALREALRLEPDNVVGLHRLADVQLLLDQADEARALLLRVVALDPNRWEAHANLTLLLARTDPRAALVHAQRAYELRPEEPRNAINLAEALALNHRRAEAVRMLEQTVSRVAPNSPLRPILEQRLAALRTQRSP